MAPPVSLTGELFLLPTTLMAIKIKLPECTEGMHAAGCTHSLLPLCVQTRWFMWNISVALKVASVFLFSLKSSNSLCSSVRPGFELRTSIVQGQYLWVLMLHVSRVKLSDYLNTLCFIFTNLCIFISFCDLWLGWWDIALTHQNMLFCLFPLKDSLWWNVVFFFFYIAILFMVCFYVPQDPWAK